MTIERSESIAGAALAALAILQLVMLGALFSGTPPHPPNAVAPFGIAPFVGASIAVAVAAIMLGAEQSRTGRTVSIFSVLMGLMSFGPQKLFDPEFGQIWPAVILGQVAMLAIAWSCLKNRSYLPNETGVES